MTLRKRIFLTVLCLAMAGCNRKKSDGLQLFTPYRGYAASSITTESNTIRTIIIFNTNGSNQTIIKVIPHGPVRMLENQLRNKKDKIP